MPLWLQRKVGACRVRSARTFYGIKTFLPIQNKICRKQKMLQPQSFCWLNSTKTADLLIKLVSNPKEASSGNASCSLEERTAGKSCHCCGDEASSDASEKVKVLANMACTPLKVKEIHVDGQCIQLFHIVGCCS